RSGARRRAPPPSAGTGRLGRGRRARSDSRLWRMRRVVVTGLGAVTPIGGDAPSTWRAAVAGESGIDWITAFDASEFPVRVAAEVKDFDPTGVASAKD